MKQPMRWALLVLLIVPLGLFAQNEVPDAKQPVLTTSAGQSADVETINVIMEQAGVGYDYCDVPTEAIIKDGVGLGGRESADTGFHVEVTTDLDTYPEGTSYQTIVFAIGASLKGMGASGLTVDAELKRLKGLIDYCQKNDVFIIAVHAGGESKRGASGSDNEKMIDAVAPFADYLVVVEDSNKDGRFTKLSEEKEIPLSIAKYALHIVGLFEQVFDIE